MSTRLLRSASMAGTFVLVLLCAALLSAPDLVNGDRQERPAIGDTARVIDGSSRCAGCTSLRENINGALTSTENLSSTISAVFCTPGKFQDKCKFFTYNYIRNAFQAVAELAESGSLCQETSICTIPSLSVKQDSKCELCKALYLQLVNVLESESVQAKVQDALRKACHKLGSQSQKCDALVDTYFPELLVLLQSVTPKEFCNLAGYCSSAAGASQPVMLDQNAGSRLAKTLADPVLQEFAVAEHILRKCGKEKRRDSEKCQYKAKRKMRAVLANLQQATSKFVRGQPEEHQLSKVPVSAASGNWPVMARWPRLRRHESATKMAHVVHGSHPVCVLCQKTYEEVINVLGSKTLQEQLLLELHEGCSLFQDPEGKQKCNVMIEQYYEAAIKLLESTSPVEFCTNAISACHAGAVSISSLNVQKEFVHVANPKQCIECRFMVNEAKKKLKDPANQEKLTEFLTESCSKVPDYSDECLLLIEQYLPELFDNVDTLLDPVKVCTKVGFCNAQSEIAWKGDPVALAGLESRALYVVVSQN